MAITKKTAPRKSQRTSLPAENPYGGVPCGGITYPPYYRPTEYLKSNNNYFPGTEPIGEDEMRVSFLGSTPFPPTKSQAGTCIMVELGNGKKFFFDFGSGCMRNIVAMQLAVQTVNDIFLTHLHVDHYADLPYLHAFAPWMGRWKPLRVHGPSGRTPRDGVKHMVEHMLEMMHWHTDSFNSFPIGDGYEVEVNEFDFRDDGGICYDQDGVTVRHWRRGHTKDGASGYRLDWNGLSFAWTGDGRPDELAAKYCAGVDVFVTELQPDIGNLTTLKYGTPALMTNTTIDQAHTPHYATGYLFEQVQPRLAMITHFTMDDAEVPEMLAGIRMHYKGLFQFGAPDVVVVNVTKDAIWTRRAALPESAMPVRPQPAEALALFDLGPGQPHVRFPTPRHSLESVQEQWIRDREYDPRLYYPADVLRDPARNFPGNFKIDVRQMAAQRVQKRVEARLGRLADKIQDGNPVVGVARHLGQALESAETPQQLLAAVQHVGLEALQQVGGLMQNRGKVSNLVQGAQKIGESLKQLQGLVQLLQRAAPQVPARLAPPAATDAERAAPARTERAKQPTKPGVKTRAKSSAKVPARTARKRRPT